MNIQLSQQGFKIGSRILDENELKVLLPSYDNIFSQIEKFREEAKNISEVVSNSKMNFEEKFDLKKDYNNIFSILGGRGTGKTSAAVTVRHKIINDNRYDDIIMPLIVPDHMGEISDALGWIITCLGEKIDILNQAYLKLIKEEHNKSTYGNKYTELFDKHCRKGQKLDLDIIYRKVSKEYYFRKKIYQRILAQEYVGKNEYVDENKEALESDQNLIKDFFRLIEEIVKVKSELNPSKEPLIYFFFDDVDISSKRGPDVLSTTMRYLTHPNIVTFICGDYKVFSEMLTIDFLQKENLLDSGLMDKIYTSHNEREFEEYTRGTENTALNLRKVRGYDYLKKMLPSALRYEMPKLSNESKANFRYTKNTVVINNELNTSKNNNEIKSNKELTLVELLEKNFYKDKELNDGKSFLKYRGSKIYSYFSIFDSTPRGLINPYYFLYQMLQDKKSEKNIWTSSDIKQFLDIIVGSSLILGNYRELINRIIRIDVKAEDKKKSINEKIEYYIDYSYLESVFDEVINEKEKYIPEKIDDFIVLFILAHFFENILIVINNNRNVLDQNLHGDRILCKILNSSNTEGNLYPQITDVNRLLYIYDLLSEKISKINSVKIFNRGEQIYFVWKYYDVLKTLSLHESNEDKHNNGDKNKELLYNLFENIFTQDREWAKSKIIQMFNFGKTNKKIFSDAIKDFQSKYAKFATRNYNLLDSKELTDFDIDNKLTVNSSKKQWKIEEINCIEKLGEILNDIEKKNEIEDKYNGNYEEQLKKLKELFIVKKNIEELKRSRINYQIQLQYCDNEVDNMKKFKTSIDEIISNRNNINREIEKLEKLVEINNAQSIIDELGDDIKYIPFDDNKLNAYKLAKSMSEKKGIDYIEILDAQKIADSYGITLSNSIGLLEINKNNQIEQSKKEKVCFYYGYKEELRFLNDYIVPEINKDLKRYGNIIDRRNELMIELERIDYKIDEFRSREGNCTINLKTSIGFQEDTIDISKLDTLIKDANECLIKIEVTEIFKDHAPEKNDILEITRNLVDIYEDIIEVSYEVIINQSEELYAVLNDETISTLKYLEREYISEQMNRKIKKLLSCGSYIDQEIIDDFKNYIIYILGRDRGITLRTRERVMQLLDKLKNVELKKKQDSNEEENIFKSRNAYEHIKFIIDDYMKLITLLDIIEVERNDSFRKLREEVFNLIGSNEVNATSKFSSYKRFIDSLQQ